MLSDAEAARGSATPRDIRAVEIDHDLVEQFIVINVTKCQFEVEDSVKCGIRFWRIESDGEARLRGDIARHTRIERSRRALVMTETELKLITAAASIGLSSRWKNGYSTPAAIGTPNEL